MKYCFFIIYIVFVFVGCAPEKNVHVKGTLSDSNAEQIYLRELGSDGTNKGDSMKLNDNGGFLFKHKISIPTFYSLTVNDKSITLLVYPGEKIVINGDASNLSLNYSVNGSEDSQNISLLNRRLEHTISVRDSLIATLKLYEGNRNIVNIKRQFEMTYMNEIDSLRDYSIRFIEKNQQSLVVIYVLYQQLDRSNYLFDREEDIKYFRKADSIFYRRYPRVAYVNRLHNNFLAINERYNAIQWNRILSMLGQNAPEIALPAPDGKVMKLSANRGKYVLIDFWASWSAPCRTENTNLLNIYEKYHGKGFEIYQISIDQSKASWERAIDEDRLPWINVSDLRFWDSDAVKLYGVETIPANFLVDRDGTIITKNLKDDALDSKLSEIFSTAE